MQNILPISRNCCRLNYKEQADIFPQVGSCKSFQPSIIENMPARKRKLGVVKSYRDYNAPNFCNLQVPINRNTDAVLFSCNLLYHAIHADRLSACQPAPPTAIVFLNDYFSLSFQTFCQPRINQPPFHDIAHERIDIFFW